MMFVGKTPWHKLGQKLERPATAAEAMAAAQLDWNVLKHPLYAGRSDRRLLPDYFAVVREDRWQVGDAKVMGIVGKAYTPLQNADAFAFFDPIVGAGAAIYHTAGALGAGERVWMLAKLPSEIRVIGDDIVEKYLLLSNSHDGKSSVQVKFTPIRVVCENTLTMALRGGPTIRAAHTRELPQRLELARHLLGLVDQRFKNLEDEFKRMVAVPMDGNRLNAYLEKVFPNPEHGSDPERYEKARQQTEYDRAGSEYKFLEGRGNKTKGVAGTLWAAYNGVAEYIDLPPEISGGDQTAEGIRKAYDHKLNSMWFGEGYSVKARAFTVAAQFTSA
jgi:phage/plasmid-like protein (TIGR03299 family)